MLQPHQNGKAFFVWVQVRMLTAWAENVPDSFLTPPCLHPEDCSPTESAPTEINSACFLVRLYVISLPPYVSICNNTTSLFSCM